MSSPETENLGKLPPGHPQAGYTSPAHEDVQGTGTVPDVEQDWYDERVEAAKAENAEIAKNEDKVKKEEEAAATGAQPKTASKAASGSSSSSSS